MITHRFFYIVFIVLLSLLSCKEDEIKLFNGKPALFVGVKMENNNVIEEDMDSVKNIAFGFSELQEITTNFMIRLQGLPTNNDRPVKIKLGGDATLGKNYIFDSNIVLPSGAHYVLLPCKILRTPDLMDAQKHITLHLVTDDTFDVPVGPGARINITDGIPTEWVNNSMAQYVLGSCRPLKYQFFYDIMGYYDLNDVAYSDLNNTAKYLNRKIEDYNINPDKYDRKYGEPPLDFRFDPFD